jgi:hypothetical protein
MGLELASVTIPILEEIKASEAHISQYLKPGTKFI